SHEVVEAMTDPNLDAIKVGTAEICDGEAKNYVAFINGYQVKSYWSESDGAYAIYDGNSQSVTVNNGELIVNGDQSGPPTKDAVTVDRNDAGGVLVNLNVESFSFSPGQVTQVTINSGSDVDTINIRSTAPVVPVVVNAGPGNDTLVDSGAGNDTLVGGANDDTYVFDTDTALGRDTINESVGGGVDALDFSDTTTRAVAVDLGNTAAQFVNTGLTLTLSANNTIEKVIGGALDDTITGNALNNVLTGGLGSDRLDGGDGGNDTL